MCAPKWKQPTKGGPVIRPLFMIFQDKQAWEIEDQYMFGPDVLVAPVLEGEQNQEVYLPAGTKWVNA